LIVIHVGCRDQSGCRDHGGREEVLSRHQRVKDDKQLHEGKKTKRGTRPGGLKRSEMVGATSEQKYHIHKGDIC
jgi:hypothetical protein